MPLIDVRQQPLAVKRIGVVIVDRNVAFSNIN
jgi:hypothetical protein